jgi:hypothetical protein
MCADRLHAKLDMQWFFAACSQYLAGSNIIRFSSLPHFEKSHFAKRVAAMGKGGKLHFAKPVVDGGLLFRALLTGAQFLRNLGDYETLSRGSLPSYEGLVQNGPLLEELLVLEPTAELHPQPVKAALLRLLGTDSSLNGTVYNGQVWINLRQERLCTLLFHVRKAARDPNTLQQAALKLNGTDMITLKKVLGLVSIPLEKGSTEDSLTTPAAHLVPPAVETEKEDAKSVVSVGKQTVNYSTDDVGSLAKGKRTLKKTVSAVSVDSDGFPAFLKHDKIEDDAPCERDPKHRNLGHKISAETWSKSQEQRQLKMSLGFESESVLKKPASAKEVKPTPSSSSSACVWVKLQKTTGKCPARSYILGSLAKGQKPKLIVEVSMKRSSQFVWIIDEIMKQLQAKHLSKGDALKLRDELCLQYP